MTSKCFRLGKAQTKESFVQFFLILQTNEFSWTKIVSLGLQLILSFFGNDNVALEKMDPGSPLEVRFTLRGSISHILKNA